MIEYPDWVTVVALTRDERRLLTVREYRHGVGAIMKGLPGGLVDRGDGRLRLSAAEVAARRELLEETGFGGGRLECLVATHPNPSIQTNAAFCFLATDLIRQRSVAIGESVEVIEDDLALLLDQLREGALAMHAVHVAALWSAAARIISDNSGRFGTLPFALRRLLTRESVERSPASTIRIGAPGSMVGG